ncbi:MAG: phosphoribosylformylglycinamidine synthase I [Planctomycetia bacterium]|nr:phosphoribosylformylglycinamidine synthase I [Planctomycetia bacterium]
MKPNVLILRAPGTNCDLETAYAFEIAGAATERIHINRVLENPALLRNFQILCFPGGFSYGDDIAAGRVLATKVRSQLLDHVQAFRDAGKLILGICNGFQILIKSGILVADDEKGAPVTLTWNKSGVYTDRWTRLQVKSQKCVFLKGIESMYLPIAHAEGKFMARDEATLDALQAQGRLVLCYEPQDNPNGAMRDVAGVCDQTGRVFGLMPHPERHVDKTQRPNWTRMQDDPDFATRVGDGLQIFKNAVDFFA